MKKLVLLTAAFLVLAACSYTKENESGAVLKVAVHDEEYGAALQELWQKKYPKAELEISVTSFDEIHEMILNQEEIEYDVFMCEDQDVPALMEQLHTVENQCEIALNPEFHEIFDRIKKVYQPIAASSDIYYMLDLEKIEADGVPLDSFETMEKVSELQNGFYYMDNAAFLFSFLTSNRYYFPGNEKDVLNFTGQSFAEALTDFQAILELIEAGDPSQFDNWFIQDSYYSGFVTNQMQYEADEQINGNRYKIVPLPTIHEHTLYLQANSYGYVVNHATQYPNAAQNLLNLMHTKEGMQLLCYNEGMAPLIPLEQVNEFDYGSDHIKEKTISFNYALSRNWVGLENKEVGAVDFLLRDDTLSKMKMCNLEKIAECQEELEEDYQDWMKEYGTYRK